jgi:hypothetical protein
MPDLIPDEIETLPMLAGQLPRRLTSKHALCILELAALAICTSVEPYQVTAQGIECLESVTGIIDLRSRQLA